MLDTESNVTVHADLLQQSRARDCLRIDNRARLGGCSTGPRAGRRLTQLRTNEYRHSYMYMFTRTIHTHDLGHVLAGVIMRGYLSTTHPHCNNTHARAHTRMHTSTCARARTHTHTHTYRHHHRIAHSASMRLRAPVRPRPRRLRSIAHFASRPARVAISY